MAAEPEPASSHAAATRVNAEHASAESRSDRPEAPADHARSGGQRGSGGISTTEGVDVRGAWDVYCDGPLLRAVQMARIFPDSKTFVDMPMKRDPEEVLEAFDALEEKDKRDPEKLASFVEAYFDEAGSDLVPLAPSDFSADPPLLGSIRDEWRRAWARSIHGLWVHLVRRTSDEARAHPGRRSLLPREHPVVVPGGRFRESYYWDTFWTIRGLLVSGMVETARGAVLNLLDDVDRYGFVPNGGRLYYTERSQPPLLSDMVCEVYLARPDRNFLARALPTLEAEHAFWMNFERGRAVCVPSPPAKTAPSMSKETLPEGGAVLLNRYWGTLDPPIGLDGATDDRGVGGPLPFRPPRPESYREDVATAGGEWACGVVHREDKSDSGGSRVGEGLIGVCHELAAAAESGWDFSSRWASDSFCKSRLTAPPAASGGAMVHNEDGNGNEERETTFCLRDTATTSVVPVDLNAFLHRTELNIARLHHALSTPRPRALTSPPKPALTAEASSSQARRRTLSAELSTQSIPATPSATGAPEPPLLLTLEEMQQVYLSRPRGWSSSSSGLMETLTPKDGEAGAVAGSLSPCDNTGGNSQAEPASILAVARRLPLKTLLFCAAARARARAIEQTMWDDESAVWRDLLLPTGEQSSSLTPACFVPMWAGLPWPRLGSDFDNGAAGAVESLRLERCVRSLRSSGLIKPGGVCTSLEDTGQQWDGTNAWPPLQWLLIQGLRRSADAVVIASSPLATVAKKTGTTPAPLKTTAPLERGIDREADGIPKTSAVSTVAAAHASSLLDPDREKGGGDAGGTVFGQNAGATEATGVVAARKLADEIEEAFLTGALAGWEKMGAMAEKYDATAVGHGGGGGEYEVQVGFGWTNAVALDLMVAQSQRSPPSVLTTP